MWTRQSRALVGDFGAGQALSEQLPALLAPLIPAPRPGGRPRTTDMRRLLDPGRSVLPRAHRLPVAPPAASPGLPALAHGVRLHARLRAGGRVGEQAPPPRGEAA